MAPSRLFRFFKLHSPCFPASGATGGVGRETTSRAGAMAHGALREQGRRGHGRGHNYKGSHSDSGPGIRGAGSKSLWTLAHVTMTATWLPIPCWLVRGHPAQPGSPFLCHASGQREGVQPLRKAWPDKPGPPEAPSAAGLAPRLRPAACLLLLPLVRVSSPAGQFVSQRTEVVTHQMVTQRVGDWAPPGGQQTYLQVSGETCSSYRRVPRATASDKALSVGSTSRSRTRPRRPPDRGPGTGGTLTKASP